MLKTQSFAFAAAAALFVCAVIIIPSGASAASYLTLGSYSGKSGAPITVSGAGFSAGSDIKVYLGQISGSPVVSGTSSQDGSWKATITPPVGTKTGSVEITAVDSKGLRAVASYYIEPYSPAVTVKAPSHAPQRNISVSGSGFYPRETVTVSLAGSVKTIVADAGGAFKDLNISIPVTEPGLYPIKAEGSKSQASVTYQFWIEGLYPWVAPSSYHLLPGQNLRFSGGGFLPDEVIEVRESKSGTALSSFKADKNGEFENAGEIVMKPGGKSATYSIMGARSGKGASLEVSIGSYTPSLSPSLRYAYPGSSFDLSGSGFAPLERVRLTALGNSIDVRADKNGNIGPIRLSSPLPSAVSNGKFAISASGDISGNAQPVEISLGAIYPSVSPTSYFARPGDPIGFRGEGFLPNEAVNVTVSAYEKAPVALRYAADALGKMVRQVYSMPYDVARTVSFVFTGEKSAGKATVEIPVGSFNPNVTASKYFVMPGETLTVSAEGFGSNETVTIGAHGQETKTTSDLKGSVAPVRMKAPYGASGALEVVFRGESSKAESSAVIRIGSFTPVITADSYFVTPGASVSVSGEGFAPGEQVVVGMAGSSSVNVLADKGGEFKAAMTVPITITSESATVTAKGQNSGTPASLIVSVAKFNPFVSPDTYYASPGSSIRFSGTGFAPMEIVSVTFNGAPAGTLKADAKGMIGGGGALPVNIESASFGFRGEISGKSNDVEISIAPLKPAIVLSTYYARGGSPLAIKGFGFVPNETVTIVLPNSQNIKATADKTGSFLARGTVPYAKPGAIAVTAAGERSRMTVTAEMTISPAYTEVKFDSYSGKPGASIKFSGTGYLPGEPIQASIGGKSVFSASANANGDVSGSIKIPSDATKGTAKAEIVGTRSFDTKTIEIYIE